MIRRRIILKTFATTAAIVAGMLLTSHSAISQTKAAKSEATSESLVPASDLFGLVVVGLGGTTEYREMFEEAASRTLDAINPTSGSGGLQLLLEPDVNREVLLAKIAEQVELANQYQEQHANTALAREPRFMLMLFGHGSFDGEHYRFNITGPDVTGGDLKTAIEPLTTGKQFLMFATSSSGAVIEAFQPKNAGNAEKAEKDKSSSTDAASATVASPVIVTATKSGGEANAVKFPLFWGETLSSRLADLDHDELLTVDEVFRGAIQGTERHYDTRKLLATEHARLVMPEEQPLVLARLGSLRGQENNPEVDRLLAERSSLEKEFNAVKAKRSLLAQSDYLDELETVLVRIARLQLRIDQATGWQPDSDSTTGKPETDGQSGQTGQSGGAGD